MFTQHLSITNSRSREGGGVSVRTAVSSSVVCGSSGSLKGSCVAEATGGMIPSFPYPHFLSPHTGEWESLILSVSWMSGAR